MNIVVDNLRNTSAGVILNHMGGDFLLLVGNVLHDIAYITL